MLDVANRLPQVDETTRKDFADQVEEVARKGQRLAKLP